MHVVMIVCILLLVFDTSVGRSIETDETRLIHHLLDGYNRKARPVINSSHTVQISTSMKILKLDEINTKSQYISVLGWISTYWNDERLTWNESDFGGVDFIALSPEDIWVPSFVLANTASDFLYDEFWYSLFKVGVKSNGDIYWAPGGKFKSECVIDINLFPFDDQICFFRFENWIYTGDKVNLTFTEVAKDVMLGYYHGNNGQWDIIGNDVRRYDIYFEANTPYPEVHFLLHVQRKVLYYVTNIILVSVLLSVLVLLMFKLPAESGERVSMGVTLLLAFSVFILMVNETIPETSSGVPLIIIYLMCFMGLTTVAIAESIFILFCYHHSGETKPPRWISYIIQKLKNIKMTFRELQKESCKKSSQYELNVVSHKSEHSENQYSRQPKDINKNGPFDKLNKCMVEDNGIYTVSNTNDCTSNIKAVEGNERKLSTGGCSQEENVLEWQNLARFVDDLSFWLCLFSFLFFKLVLLIILPHAYGNKDLQEFSVPWISDH